MIQMLVCPGPPEHEFPNPNAGKRGRPPKFCGEHKPVKDEKKPEERQEVIEEVEEVANPFIKKAQSSATDVTVVTDDDEEDTPVNPFIQKAQSKPVSEEPIRAKREKYKPPKPVPDRIEDIEQEYMEIDERITRAREDYKTSKDRAMEIGVDGDTDFHDIQSDFEHAWNACDSKMASLMNAITRKRWLEKRVEELTDPKKFITMTDTITMTAPPPIVRETEATIADTFAKIDDEETMREEREQYEAEIEDLDEDELGYNDLLSNPEQYDDDTADRFAAIMDEFEE